MERLNQYSGNVTTVPNGTLIMEQLPDIKPQDYAKIYTILRFSLGDNPPGLWIAMLANLGIIIAILLLISMVMQIVFRVRRRSLRRRLERGDVNLELLGIKRLRVPPDVVSCIPRYTYSAQSKRFKQRKGHARTMSTSFDTKEVDWDTDVAMDGSLQQQAFSEQFKDVSNRKVYPAESQQTCAICFEDFEPGVDVRQLRCGDIFHPNCIDPYLSSCSSLCPICKRSAVSFSQCYAIELTRALIRRERQMWKLRPKVKVLITQSKVKNRGLPFGLKRVRGHFLQMITAPSDPEQARGLQTSSLEATETSEPFYDRPPMIDRHVDTRPATISGAYYG